MYYQVVILYISPSIVRKVIHDWFNSANLVEIYDCAVAYFPLLIYDFATTSVSANCNVEYYQLLISNSFIK